MKLTLFLAVFTVLGRITANPVQAGTLANPEEAPPKRHLVWEPTDAYKKKQLIKELWEEKCEQALAQKGCVSAIIYPSARSRVKGLNGVAGSYVNVEASQSMDLTNRKKMRVFKDGSYQDLDKWPARDRKAMLDAQRPEKITNPPQPQKAMLFWGPPDTYQNQPGRKVFWEERCGKILAREGCDVGMIHRGETRVILPDHGKKRLYVNVEGAPLMDMNKTKKLRVYQDATSEDFTEKGWTEKDRMAIAKGKTRRPSASAVKPAQEVSKHRITWSPPNAYKDTSPLRKAYEKACHQVLEREGCDFAIMLKRQHRLHNPGPGMKSRYLTVAVGKQDQPENKRYMMLFDDGSSKWYPPGPLPVKDRRGQYGPKPACQGRTFAARLLLLSSHCSD